jgi:hypothetical protein
MMAVIFNFFLLFLEIVAAGYTTARAPTTRDVSNPRSSRPLLVRKFNAAQGTEKHPYDIGGGGTDSNTKVRLVRAGLAPGHVGKK